jgi:hypothetical protein
MTELGDLTVLGTNSYKITIKTKKFHEGYVFEKNLYILRKMS